MRLPPHSNDLSRPKNPVFNKNGGTRKRLTAGACGSASAVSFPSSWQAERAKILDRACAWVLRGTQNGRGLLKSAWVVARRYDGRILKSDGSRRLRLSAKTLTRLYYMWQSADKAPGTFALRYRNARPKIGTAMLSRFVQSCLTPDTGSYRAAFARMKNPAATVSAFQKTFPRPLRIAVTRIFARERAAHNARLAALKIARSATLPQTGSRSRSLRAFKPVLKASQKIVKPASEARHA